VNRFASVILDVDSTLAGIEGIDWLADRRGTHVAGEVARLTDQAMNGEIGLEQVYGARISVVSPTREDIDALAAAYQASVAPGAGSAVAQMRASGVELALVSGGLLPAILPLAESLGFPAHAVHAVDIVFDDRGRFTSFDRESPLTRSDGKARIAQALGMKTPILAVGDGMTDLAMKPCVDAFAAFTGFVRRDKVAQSADHEVASFEQILKLVLE
jgi:phosphoserine phosphatase